MIEVMHWGGGAQPDDVACKCGCICGCFCYCSCSNGDYNTNAISDCEVGETTSVRNNDVASTWFSIKNGTPP